MKYNFEIPLQGEILTNLKVDNVHGWKNFYVPFKEIKSNGFYIEEMQTCLSHKRPIWWAIKGDGKATLPLDHWIWCSIICIISKDTLLYLNFSEKEFCTSMGLWRHGYSPNPMRFGHTWPLFISRHFLLLLWVSSASNRQRFLLPQACSIKEWVRGVIYSNATLYFASFITGRDSSSERSWAALSLVCLDGRFLFPNVQMSLVQ